MMQRTYWIRIWKIQHHKDIANNLRTNDTREYWKVINSRKSVKQLDIEFQLPFIIMFVERVMVFNVTFNNISAISRRSVLLVEETGVSRKNPPTCHKSLTNSIFFFVLKFEMRKRILMKRTPHWSNNHSRHQRK